MFKSTLGYLDLFGGKGMLENKFALNFLQIHLSDHSVSLEGGRQIPSYALPLV